jgi:hypothetical protein
MIGGLRMFFSVMKKKKKNLMGVGIFPSRLVASGIFFFFFK